MMALDLYRATRIAHRFGLSMSQAHALALLVWEGGRD